MVWDIRGLCYWLVVNGESDLYLESKIVIKGDYLEMLSTTIHLIAHVESVPVKLQLRNRCFI